MKDFKDRVVTDQKHTDNLNRDMKAKEPRRNEKKENGLKFTGMDAGMFRRYSFDDNGGGYAGL